MLKVKWLMQLWLANMEEGLKNKKRVKEIEQEKTLVVPLQLQMQTNNIRKLAATVNTVSTILLFLLLPAKIQFLKRIMISKRQHFFLPLHAHTTLAD